MEKKWYRISYQNSFDNFFMYLYEEEKPRTYIGGEIVKNIPVLGGSASLQFECSEKPDWFLEIETIGIDTIKEKILGELVGNYNHNAIRSANNKFCTSTFDVDFIDTIKSPLLKLIVKETMQLNIERVRFFHADSNIVALKNKIESIQFDFTAKELM